jgi:hypothetical protein
LAIFPPFSSRHYKMGCSSRLLLPTSCDIDCPGNTKGGRYRCTVDLLFDWFGISCMTADNFCFYLQNRLIQTSQTGGQWYSDTSPFSIPFANPKRKLAAKVLQRRGVPLLNFKRLALSRKHCATVNLRSANVTRLLPTKTPLTGHQRITQLYYLGAVTMKHQSFEMLCYPRGQGK